MSQRAGSRYRLRRQRDVARVFEEGRRASDARVTLYAVRNPGRGHPRVAVAVPRKRGTAVARNRLKRLCREALRLSRSDLAVDWDYVLVPRGSKGLTVDKLRASIRALTGRLSKQRQG